MAAKLLGILLALSAGVAAAPIPEEATIIAYARPEGSRFRALVRLPMAVFADIRFPVQGAANDLDLPQTEAMLPGVAKYWIAPSLEVLENSAALPPAEVVETRLAVESDESFASFDRALAHLHGARIDPAANVFWRQAWVDVLLEYPIHAAASDFAIQFRLAHLASRVTTNLTYIAPGGAVRTFSYQGDPGVVRLDPRWDETARRFVPWGFRQFFGAADYLLFAFCLVLPLRSWDEIASAGGAFVVASSVAMFAATGGLVPEGLWFRPMVEMTMAIGILYLALANIAGWISPGSRAFVALGFGLIYGFGFSFDLGAKLQFAGTHPAVAAGTYDLGIEVAFLLGVAGIAVLARRFRSGFLERLIPSILAAHVAWHWMAERWERVSLFRLQWPEFDAAFLSDALRWLTILVLLFGGAWFVFGLLRAKNERGPAA